MTVDTCFILPTDRHPHAMFSSARMVFDLPFVGRFLREWHGWGLSTHTSPRCYKNLGFSALQCIVISSQLRNCGLWLRITQSLLKAFES